MLAAVCSHDKAGICIAIFWWLPSASTSQGGKGVERDLEKKKKWGSGDLHQNSGFFETEIHNYDLSKKCIKNEKHTNWPVKLMVVETKTDFTDQTKHNARDWSWS